MNVGSSFFRASLGLGAVLIGCSTHSTSDDATRAASADLYERSADAGSEAGPTPVNPLPEEWPNNGSADCVQHVNADPSIFKLKYDENTFILRENKCLNFEANFIYLLFGHDKVLMQDTGSIPSDMARDKFTRAFPIHDTVEAIIGEWLTAHPAKDGTPRTRESIELLVTHTHSHGDHVSGDYQFKQANGSPLPYTRVAGLRPTEVATFFGITDWPNKSATVDLGGRKVDVLPIPGHEPSHVAIYDHGAQLLLSGDSLYPGHIFVRDWPGFRASTQRLAAWIHENDAATGAPLRPITHVLGTHIEKKPADAQFYPYPSWIQDPERKLELTAADIDFLAQQTEALGPSGPTREVFYPNFSIDP